MRQGRNTTIAVGSLVAVVWLAALAQGYFEEHTAARAKVSVAILFLERATGGALEDACLSGKFISASGLRDLGVPEPDRSAYIADSKFTRLEPGKVQVTAVLPEINIKVIGLATAVPGGSTITFEYACTAQKAFSARFFASTVPPKYLDSRYRSR